MRPIVERTEANARLEEIHESIWYFLDRLRELRLATSVEALNDKAEAKLKEAIIYGENFLDLISFARGWNSAKEN